MRIYGQKGCEHTRATRDQLKLLGIPYEYVDIGDDDSAARQVEEWNDGKRRTPTVALLSGERLTVLSVPSAADLEAQLTRLGALRETVPPSPS